MAVTTWRESGRDRDPFRSDATPLSCPSLRLARNLPAGSLIGLTTGFFGVGGGSLIVPTLAVALALSIRLAVGTSLAIITAISVMALVAHLAAGRTLGSPSAAMTAACIA